MAFFYYLTFLALVSAPSVWGYSSGAPPTGCSILGPKHPGSDGKPIEAKRSAAPYRLTLGSKSVAAGQPLEVQLISTGTEDIQGFLIQAQLDNKPVGVFSANPSGGHAQILECNAPGDSLTHTKIKDLKVKSVNFLWTPSADLQGKTVKLTGTVASGYDSFWVKGVTADIHVA